MVVYQKLQLWAMGFSVFVKNKSKSFIFLRLLNIKSRYFRWRFVGWCVGGEEQWRASNSVFLRKESYALKTDDENVNIFGKLKSNIFSLWCSQSIVQNRKWGESQWSSQLRRWVDCRGKSRPEGGAGWQVHHQVSNKQITSLILVLMFCPCRFLLCRQLPSFGQWTETSPVFKLYKAHVSKA